MIWSELFDALGQLMLDLLLFSPAGNSWAAAIAGIFGLLIGSFLNVVIYRLPKMMQREADNYVAQESGSPLPHAARFNLTVPRSACPHCGHRITAMEKYPDNQLSGFGGQRQPVQSAYFRPLSDR